MARTQINGGTDVRSGTITADRFVSGLALPSSQLADGANFLKRDGSVAMTAAFNAGGQLISSVATPVAGTDAANKSYVDAKVAGFQIHFARVVSVSNVTLSGLQTIDGYTLAAADRVLLTAQTTGSQNGLWVAAAGSWTRPTDWAAASSLPEGQYVIVEADGTTYKNTKWFNTNTGTITVDTTATTFSQDASGTSYTANTAAGLSLTGTQFAVKTGNGVGFDGSGNVQAVADGTRNMQVTSTGIGIKDGTAGQILLANASGNAAYATVTGDVTITSAGATTVNNTSGSGFTKYGNFVKNETLSGAINGTNTSFALANTPASGTVELYYDGLLLRPGAGNDYTISGATITSLFTPQSGDSGFIANYMK